MRIDGKSLRILARGAAMAAFWALFGCASKQTPASETQIRLLPRPVETEREPHDSATPRAIEPAPSPELATPEPSLPAPAPPPKRKEYKRVLSVGDSFNGAFSLALDKKFRAEGTSMFRDVWVGVSVVTFDREPRFSNLVRQVNPDLVVVTLGANDLDWKDPAILGPHVQAIVKRIGARDCYWVGPVTWKDDKGAVDVIAKNVAPCTFFDSRGIVVERHRDRIHPTAAGGVTWVDQFWTFFQGPGAIVSASPP